MVSASFSSSNGEFLSPFPLPLPSPPAPPSPPTIASSSDFQSGTERRLEEEEEEEEEALPVSGAERRLGGNADTGLVQNSQSQCPGTFPM
jgi:hypothetical protein